MDWGYEYLFTVKPDEQRTLHHERLSGYRSKRVKAGDMLYLTIYPLYRDRQELSKARQKRGISRDAQNRLNRKNCMLRIEQYVNANFRVGDVFITLTYSPEETPEAGMDGVRRDVKNYIARLRRAAKKLERELRYLYVIERSEPFDHDPNGEVRYHVHMVLSGVSREQAEYKWPYGYANSRKLQDSDKQFAGIANYMLKRRGSERTWEKSRNLIEPKELVADKQVSRRRVEQIARDVRAFGKEILEKIYHDYRCIEEPEVKLSDYLPGAYIRVRMRRRETQPATARRGKE